MEDRHKDEIAEQETKLNTKMNEQPGRALDRLWKAVRISPPQPSTETHTLTSS